MSHVKNFYDKYYMNNDDDNLSTEEHVGRASIVSVYERSIILTSSKVLESQLIYHGIL